ncbi:glycosyltransferase family 9 protein [Pelosinus propionicus]|uniref:Heptosyltransferase-2 n=1 Tax=Pelosinus propionicus DSM 13327 TaxID=1123291 RepID=A0A1I4MQX2_9FIRM|nr:glycosyltransferase family 9 protein [Pelosinus propionicus]SFM05425.1 heptosyltransferase-2 [Pelosinus propionicus DSM 13327]
MQRKKIDVSFKILVINLLHLGDLLLATPVVRALRTHYPQAHIALLADAKLQDLVKYNKNIDELLLIDKKGYHNKLSNYVQFISEIRSKKFDIVINLHENERASCIAAFSGGKKIVGYSTCGLHLFFDKVIENRKGIKHQVHSHFDVLRETLDITKINDQGLEMWLDEKAEESAGEIWNEAFPIHTHPEKERGAAAECIKVVGLNIGASWSTKCWRKEYFTELADRLLDMGYGVAYYGGPMDIDIVNETINLMRNKEHTLLKNFAGKMSLLELAALLKKASVLVTNDTGPMHVAVAMKVPVVAIFGPSPVVGFYPYNNTSVVLKSSVECHPCGKHSCPKKHECMWQIDVDTVMKYTLEQLEHPQRYTAGSYIVPGQ